jgi:hypothetical protein
MIKKLVPCGNPVARMFILTPKRSMPADNFQSILRMGKYYCAWCGVKELPKGKRKYCGSDCQESCYISCYPQTNDGIAYLIMERGCHCAMCGFSWEDFLNMAKEKIRSIASLKIERKSAEKYWLTEIFAMNAKMVTGLMVDRLKMLTPPGRGIEVDYIIPVALGGVTFGFENLQLLCYGCHKIKTKKDMENIRAAKNVKEE